MENIILLLIAITSVLFVWLLWARQVLIGRLRSLQRAEEILRLDLQKRRDMVPYLLESFRKNHEITPEWSAILEQRKTFNSPNKISLNEELAFESNLEVFILNNHVSDVNYLDAEKIIMGAGETINKEIQNHKDAQDAFARTSKRFPYFIASAIFGIR